MISRPYRNSGAVFPAGQELPLLNRGDCVFIEPVPQRTDYLNVDGPALITNDQLQHNSSLYVIGFGEGTVFRLDFLNDVRRSHAWTDA